MAEIKLHADTVSVELTPEQARVAAKLDEIFEDEAQALRSKALEEMRGSA